MLSYSLNAHSPVGGLPRRPFNGTEGRARARGGRARRGPLAAAATRQGSVVDPSAVHDADRRRTPSGRVGERLLLQRHWETAQEIADPGRRRRPRRRRRACCWTTCSAAPARTRWAGAAGYLDGVRSVDRRHRRQREPGRAPRGRHRRVRPAPDVGRSRVVAPTRPAGAPGAPDVTTDVPMRTRSMKVSSPAVPAGSARSVVAGLAGARPRGHLAGPGASCRELPDARAGRGRPHRRRRPPTPSSPGSGPRPSSTSPRSPCRSARRRTSSWDTNTTIAFAVLQSAVTARRDAGSWRPPAPPSLGYGAPARAGCRRTCRSTSSTRRGLERLRRSPSSPSSDRARCSPPHRETPCRFAAFRPCYVISPEEWAGAPTQQGHTVARAAGRSGPVRGVTVQLRRRARCRRLRRHCCWHGCADLPNGETFFVGADDALATEPLAELIPQFLPGTEELAAGLTGTARRSRSPRPRSLLGWRPVPQLADRARHRPAVTLIDETLPHWSRPARIHADP